jgi:threonine/homoserine/homoserine lactone efflux protein
MLTPEVVLTFFAASLLLGIVPGPDNLFVLSQSALHGRRAGLVVTLGLCTGLIAHTSAVALGVAVIFQTSALAFSLLKYAGAAYLAWLAWGAFRASATRLPQGKRGAVGLGKLYRRGILMNVTNPKVSIFFLAFLPQFADPARGPVAVQMFLLGGLFLVASILVFGGVALLAGTVGQWLARSARAQTVLNRLAGLVFLGLALKLATTER